MGSPTRAFTQADQQRFALLTGDANPMHMDEEVARLTPAGARVVHGLHIVLWALETLVADGLEIGRCPILQVRFSKFALLDQGLSIQRRETPDASAKFEIACDGLVLASIVLKCGRPSLRERPAGERPAPIAVPAEPREPDEEQTLRLRIVLTAPAELAEFAAMFPRLCDALGTERVRGLALLSPLVGMVCPGLHSIFSGFTARLDEIDAGAAGIEAWTLAADARFRLVTLGFAGAGLGGEVAAYQRFAPIESSLAAIAEMVEPGEFAGRMALVVGGSRGLGAASAKLIVAGGGRAVITYARGAGQAQKIAEELSIRFGPGRCVAVRFEVGVTSPSSLLEQGEPYTHVYYFASPQIFRQSGSLFDTADFAAFTRIYIDGFYSLISALAAPAERLWVFYPSSTAVEKRPRQMTAYAMAKAAGEVLCQDLQRALPGLMIQAPRLPRILTDQTAVTPPAPAADAASVLLPLLRAEVAPA